MLCFTSAHMCQLGISVSVIMIHFKWQPYFISYTRKMQFDKYHKSWRLQSWINKGLKYSLVVRFHLFTSHSDKKANIVDKYLRPKRTWRNFTQQTSDIWICLSNRNHPKILFSVCWVGKIVLVSFKDLTWRGVLIWMS